MSHVRSMYEFIDYCDKVLPDHDKDRNMPYIFAGFSGVTIVVLFVVGTEIGLYQLVRQIII